MRVAHRSRARVQLLERGKGTRVLKSLRDRRDLGTGATELETYRFWHLPYGEAAYYNQLVFKRHEPIPPENVSSRSARQGVDGSSVGSLAGIPTK
jgi:hypothetical protein